MSKLEPIVKEFSTWDSFVTHCETEPSDVPLNHKASRPGGCGVSKRDYQEFTKCNSWEDAIKLAHEGWAEGAKTIKVTSAPMFQHVSKMIERVDVSHDVEGHAIDVARYVDGEPECWLKFEQVLQESEFGTRLVRVVLNVSASSGVSTDVIMRKGATIAALVELLEYAGHRVELTFNMSVSDIGNGKSVLELFARVKDYDQPLDMAKVAYILAHPSVLRVLCFAYEETLPEEYRQVLHVGQYARLGGYGKPVEASPERRGDIYVGASSSCDIQWEDADSAEQWVLSQLRKQGIHIKTEKE